MLAVSAVEADPPAGAEPAAWLLLASAGEACAEDARTAVHRYRKRWTVEEFFLVLKSGLRVEERRFDHAEDLRKCLAFAAATACRVFDIARAARETPDDPRVRGRARTHRRLPALEASAAARNPEALVRMDDLRADDAALPG